MWTCTMAVISGGKMFKVRKVNTRAELLNCSAKYKTANDKKTESTTRKSLNKKAHALWRTHVQRAFASLINLYKIITPVGR